MAEFEKQDIYACALAMPDPDRPSLEAWVNEITRHTATNNSDEIYLVGHSLGVPAILSYLGNARSSAIKGAILVSGPSEKNQNRMIDSFFATEFDFAEINTKCKRFSIIHGDNDPYVPVDNAKYLADKLSGELIVIENGQHLNGSAGWLQLPQCLEALERMMG